MSALIAAIGGKIGLIGLGALIPLLFMLGKKFIPKYFGGIFSKALGHGISNIDKIADPKLKELIHNIAIDLVKLAEYQCPDKGQGKTKFNMVAAKICSLLPFLKGRDKDISDIIENAVAAMDDELKKQIPPAV